MTEITSYGPVNRHIREYLTTEKGVRTFRCNTLQNPLYYVDDRGVLKDIALGDILDTSSKVGSIWLRRKNIVSLGIRQADTAEKFIGLRPDDCQGGGEQLEFSLLKIELNTKPEPLDFSTKKTLSNGIHELGPVVVQHTRQRCRLMVPATNAVREFKVQFLLHTKGLRVVERRDLDEYWFYNGEGVFRFRLARPRLINSATLDPVCDANGDLLRSLVQHNLADNGDGTYVYTKSSNDAIADVKLPSEYFIDADTVYSSTADGFIENTGTSFSASRSASSGTTVNDTNTTYTAPCSRDVQWAIRRCFFYYDVSELTGTVSGVDELIYAGTLAHSDVTTQQGTQESTLGLADFDSFSGNAFASVDWTASQYNTLAYNSAGITAVQSVLGSGTYKSCTREKDHDYDNVEPSGAFYSASYFADDGSGTKDPYLFVTTGSGATTYTGTVSVGALIQQSGITGSVNLGALLQQTVSGTVNAGALLQGVNTGMISLGALLLLVKTGDLSLDALLQVVGTQTVSVGALLQTARSGSADLDALLQAVGSQTMSVDAILTNAISRLVSLDALLQVVGTHTVSVDAILALARSGGVSLDAVLQLLGRGSVSVGALLETARSGSAEVDALLQVVGAQTVSVGALLQTARSGSAEVDALLQVVGTQTVSVDAILALARSGGVSFDAILRTMRHGSVSVGALLQKVFEGGLSLDAVLLSTAGSTVSLDALLGLVVTGAVSLSALLMCVIGNGVALDAWVVEAGYVPVYRNTVEGTIRDRVITMTRQRVITG